MSAYAAILREAGALGDTICTFAVAAALHLRYPDVQVVHFGVEQFRSLVALSPDTQHFVATSFEQRRPRRGPLDPARYPYLDRGPVPFREYVHVADCWDGDMTRRENENFSRPLADWKGRIRFYLEHAGLWSDDLPADVLCPRIDIPDEANAWADEWLAEHSLGPGPIVGLQPFSTCRQRDWPKAHWIDLARRLRARGLTTLVFDSASDRTKSIEGIPCLGLPYAHLAALLVRCSLLIAPDSGLFHLAAAVETPALGLFGPTLGQAIARTYPRAQVMQKNAGDFEAPNGCVYPCYRRGFRGADRCSKHCRALAAIEPGAVVSRVIDRLGVAALAACVPRATPATTRRHAGLVMTCPAMGDTLFAFPVAQELQRRGYEVTVWSYAASRELWAMCPAVDHWIELRAGRQRSTGQFNPRRYPCFDAGPVPINAFDRVDDLWMGCAAQRVHMLRSQPVSQWHSRIWVFLTKFGLYEELAGAERFARYQPRAVIMEAAREWADGWLAAHALGSRRIVGFACYANAPERSWPSESGAALVRRLEAAGHAVIVFDRDGRSQPLRGIQATGLPIQRLAALIARCQVFIGVDSGPHNLAAAVGIRTIGLFGFSPGTAVCEFYPRTTVLQKSAGEFDGPRGCQFPCYEQRARGCGLCRGRPCPAIAAISPEEVLKVVDTIFADAPSPEPNKFVSAHQEGRRVEIDPQTDGEALFSYWRQVFGDDYLGRARCKNRDAEILARAVGHVRGLRMLDIGCAGGSTAARLRELGADIWGCDVFAWPITHCQHASLAGRLFQADVRDLSRVRNEMFDVAYTFGCLEHLPQRDIPTALAEIRRILRPGALLVISVPAVVPGATRDVTHITVVDEATWHDWLTCAGFNPSAPRPRQVASAMAAHARAVDWLVVAAERPG